MVLKHQQPPEDGAISISRAAGSFTFPARFMLVVAMNHCPCGYYGDFKRECRCAPSRSKTTANASPAPCSTATRGSTQMLYALEVF